MDKQARGAIIGMVLGDACINVRTRQSKYKAIWLAAEMVIVHSMTQEDYCLHKAGLVKKYFGGNFNVNRRWHGPENRYECARFSVSNPYFRQVRKWCYPEGRKTYTRFVLDMLTDEGIAIWYMDDGHARRNVNKEGWVSSVATSIATMCSKDEVSTIIEWFREKHSIDWKARYDKRRPEDGAWYIECNTENSRLFAHLIRPYVIDSMMYKLSHVADLASHECRAPVGSCSTCGGVLYDKRRGGLCGTCYSRRNYREVRRIREGRKPVMR